MSVKAYDGKIFKFEPADSLPCCFVTFFKCISCDCIGPATMIMEVKDETHSAGTKAMLCGGVAPMSPCPCCTYCGFGPCAARWAFAKSPTEEGKWYAEGSAFAGGCCLACTNHNGDNFTWNDSSNGTAEKPFIMTAGMNPMNPPCFAGKQVLKMYEVADRKGTPLKGGAPESQCIAR